MSSFREPYTVTRPAGGSFTNGYWSEGTPSTIDIEASVQPADGPTRKNVPEGYDQDSAMMLYTDTELKAAGRDTQKSDYLTLFGERYDVVAVQPWQNDVISHYAVTVAKPNQ